DQGKRLPTEAEWEWAARGAEGRRFPWGAAEPHPSMAHYAAPAPIEVDASLEGASPEGVLHLSGNVAEWVADWWDPMAYHSSAERNPAGPSRGEYRVTRGGSYADAAPSLSATARGFHTPTRGSEMIGFRCVQ
ncbi:MAG: SUMF1/EgtB/PvdO family nonheme iron enzyme, partial [Candidatus Latescibacterota bacterium]|nr:SUMF1/EgtB/PvdO family nonheme iron enzyme [Candidatus Latescibacterota bacterium]